MFACEVASDLQRGEWKYSGQGPGVLSVTMIGISMMPTLYASSWVLVLQKRRCDGASMVKAH